MDQMGKWIAGSVAGLLGVLGLFLASHAGGGALYSLGLGLTVLAVLFIFFPVRRAFDEANNRHR